jgi:hypothetical protein
LIRASDEKNHGSNSVKKMRKKYDFEDNGNAELRGDFVWFSGHSLLSEILDGQRGSGEQHLTLFRRTCVRP